MEKIQRKKKGIVYLDLQKSAYFAIGVLIVGLLLSIPLLSQNDNQQASVEQK